MPCRILSVIVADDKAATFNLIAPNGPLTMLRELFALPLLNANQTGVAASCRSSRLPSVVQLKVPEDEPVTVNEVNFEDIQSRPMERETPLLDNVT
jgi:hypothetical protein